MTRKMEMKRNKCMMRTKILWKRERKTDTEVKMVVGDNMNQKLTETISNRPSLYGQRLEGKE